MKIPKTAIQTMIGLEGVILILVIVFAVLNPIKNAVVKNDDFHREEQNNVINSTETQQTEVEELPEVPTVETLVYSETVQQRVMSMSVEEKVAQMFITTPEQLTGMRQVTVTGNTSRNAISNFPVGGLMYSLLNLEGKAQTSTMLQRLQTYYGEQFGMPLFTMLPEAGGNDRSPLASENGFTVEKSAEEVNTENNVEAATLRTTNIAGYMSAQGFNTNTGIDATLSPEMLDATIRAYKTAGMFTTYTIPSEVEWTEEQKNICQTAVTAGTDMIMVGPAFTTDAMAALRYDMGYQGIIVAESSNVESVTQAINEGADMIYISADFKATYQSIVDAVAGGTINEELINEAVMRILTYKGYE